jgi:hypothetical protein
VDVVGLVLTIWIVGSVVGLAVMCLLFRGARIGEQNHDVFPGSPA